MHKVGGVTYLPTSNGPMILRNAQVEDPGALLALITKANYRVGLLAGLLGVSPSHLNSMMWKACRQTPGEIINVHRVRRAKELLLRGQMVKTAAFELGFSDPHHFCRWFKRQTGASPSQFAAVRAREIGTR